MRIEQLLYLKDLSETHSITQTAQRFFMTQQGLSNAIRNLENEYNVTLLTRSNQGVSLTSEGQLFLAKAQKLIDDYNELKTSFVSLEEKTDSLQGIVKIACHARLLDAFLIDILETASIRYPFLQFNVIEEDVVEFVNTIEEKEIDIAISLISDQFFDYSTLKTVIADKNFVFTILYADFFVYCCKKNHPLAQHSTLIFEQILSHPMVIFNQIDAYPKVLWTNQIRDAHNFQNRFVTNNTSFHRSMIKRGLAGSLLSAFEFRKLYRKHTYLTAIPISDLAQFTFFVIHQKNDNLSPAAAKILELIQTYDFARN